LSPVGTGLILAGIVSILQIGGTLWFRFIENWTDGPRWRHWTYDRYLAKEAHYGHAKLINK
jgi:hypothetical protein